MNMASPFIIFYNHMWLYNHPNKYCNFKIILTNYVNLYIPRGKLTKRKIKILYFAEIYPLFKVSCSSFYFAFLFRGQVPLHSDCSSNIPFTKWIQGNCCSVIEISKFLSLKCYVIFPSGRFPALQKGTQIGEWWSGGTDRKWGVQGPWSPSELSLGLSVGSFHDHLFPYRAPHSLLFRDWNYRGGNEIFFLRTTIFHLDTHEGCAR